MESTIYTRGRARRSLIDTISLRVVSQLTTVLGYVVLVRGMSEQQFGVYNLLYSFVPVVGTVLSLGLEQVLQRYQPEYLRLGNRPAAAWLMRTISSLRFIANAVMLAVVLLAWDHIAPIFKLTPYRSVFAFFSLLILLQFQSRVLQLGLGSHMMHRYSVGSMTLLSILKLVMYSILYGLHRLTLEAAIFVDTVAYACAYVSMRILYRRLCLTPAARKPYKPGPAERKRLMRYGFLNNFNDAGVFLLYSSLDNFFIAGYMDTLSVGIYSFYSRLRQMVVNSLPAKLFENVIQPLFFSIPSQQAPGSIPRYFSFLLDMNFLLAWPAFAFSCAYHAELVQVVFGGKFIEHSWLLPVVMAFATLNVIADPVSIVAQYEEKAGILLISKVFAGYNILAMIALVPVLGIYGAALAAGSAQALKNIFIWWNVRKLARWLNVRAALLSSIGLWGAAVALCYGLKAAVPLPPLLRLLCGVVVFVGAGLLYLRSPALSASDRSILRAVAPDKAVPLLLRVGLLKRSG